MQYVILNRNSVEGYQKGYFETLPPCFFEDSYIDDNDQIMYRWTPCLGVAKRFKTEEDAWDFGKATGV